MSEMHHTTSWLVLNEEQHLEASWHGRFMIFSTVTGIPLRGATINKGHGTVMQESNYVLNHSFISRIITRAVKS